MSGLNAEGSALRRLREIILEAMVEEAGGAGLCRHDPWGLCDQHGYYLPRGAEIWDAVEAAAPLLVKMIEEMDAKEGE